MARLDPREGFDILKEKVTEAITSNFPREGKDHILEIEKVLIPDNLDPDDVEDQKKAKLRGVTWGVPVKASLVLKDKASGKVIDKQTLKVATLPKYTRRHSYIVGGSEYQVDNQWRLKPGIYTRVAQNGELQSRFNFKGQQSLDMSFDPKTKQFRLKHGGSKPPLYPILKAVGIDDDAIESSWGKDILNANKTTVTGKLINVQKTAIDFAKRVSPRAEVKDFDDASTVIRSYLGEASIRPDVTKLTLGKEFSNITPEVLTLSSKRLLGVARGTEKPDVRDALMFKDLLSTEDFLAERMGKNTRTIQRRIHNNLDRRDKVKDIIGPDIFARPINEFFSKSSLANTPQQVNPLEMLGGQQRTTITGEGGVKDANKIMEDAKLVDPSHFGILDPLHTPENEKTGVSLHLSTSAVKKGNTVLVPMINVKTGKTEMLDPRKVNDSIIAMPDEGEWKKGKWVPKTQVVKASSKGNEIRDVKARDVQYVMANNGQMFSIATNMVPFLNSDSPNRSTMAGRHMEQAIPLKYREAPLVQSDRGDGRSYDELVGRYSSHEAPIAGKVTKVEPGKIVIKGVDGKERQVQLYDNYPLNEKKGVMQSTPQVHVGSSVKKGQLIADTNFTKGGVYAPGTNLRVGYTPWKGYNFEDGVVISESAAEKLTSEHLYKKSLSSKEAQIVGKKKFMAYKAATLGEDQVKKLDDDGIIRIGQKVHKGDPLIVALAESAPTTETQMLKKLHRSLAQVYDDRSVKWDGDYEGEVIGVSKKGKDIQVHVRTAEKMEIGDKLAGRHGNKGIVTQILPDVEMPHTMEGKPLEVVMNPIGIAGRMNVGQVLETAAGKLAEKQGKPFKIQNFGSADNRTAVEKEIKKAGVSDKETIVDPVSNTKIPGVLVGNQYILKLQHQVDKKMSTRSRDAYDRNLVPKGGGPHGAQALGALGVYAMLAHGAKANIREMQTLKSDKDQMDEVWTALQAGEPIPPPKTTFAYKKFESYLNGLGVNVTKDGNSLNLSPMTDKQVLEMSNGRLMDAGRAVRGYKIGSKAHGGIEPEKSGLFDTKITGGLDGQKWCFHPSTKVITNQGLIPIGRIVEERLDLKVLSRTHTGSLEWRRISNYWKNHVDQDLVALHFQSNGHLSGYQRRSSRISTLWCTPRHEIYSGERKLYAKNMASEEAVLASHCLSEAQIQLVLGSLLGDAHLDGGGPSRNWMFRCGHGPSQYEYLGLKTEVLSEFVDAPIFDQCKKEDGLWKERITHTMRTIRHPVFSDIHDLTYRDNRKTVTRQWLDQLDERGLAYWFFDDGSTARVGNKLSTVLCTHSYYKHEVELIQTWLEERWGISSTIQRQKQYEGKEYGWYLLLASTQVKRLLWLVAPFAPDCLRYKVDMKYAPGHCKSCSCEINPLYDVCDQCVLKQVFSARTKREYQGRDDRLLDESTLRQRYGSWSETKNLSEESVDLVNVAAPVDEFEELRSRVGSRLQDLVIASSCSTVPVRIDSVDDSSSASFSKCRTVYNLEVEGNHNYFANGLLVGNSHIELDEPVPNPIFEKAVKSLTGVRGPQFDRIVKGEVGVDKSGKIVPPGTEGAVFGPHALGYMLDKVDVKKELASLEARISKLKDQPLNEARKKIKYLRALNRLGVSPKEAYMTKNVPVLPPAMRPLSSMADGGLQFDDLNQLYKDIGILDNQLRELPKYAPESVKATPRADIYDRLKALSGVQSSLKGRYTGIADIIAGDSPKFGFAQDKLIKRKQDLTMRSTIVPEPSLSLDEIGIPRTAATELYKPFVVRDMRASTGMGPLSAKQLVEKDPNHPLVRAALDKVVSERPLLVKRDPALHKYNIQAFKPKLTKGKAISIHPLVCSGYNADFDGDQMSAYVPLTQEAVEEARKLHPSNILFNPATANVMYTPTHESQVGLYMMSEVGKRTRFSFKNLAEAEKARRAGKLAANDVATIGGVRTTIDRIKINEVLPSSLKDGALLKDMNFKFTKAEQNKLFGDMARANKNDYAKNIDNMKNLGNSKATFSGFSFGLDDFKVHRDVRDPILREAAMKTSKLNLDKPADMAKFVDTYEGAMKKMQSKLKEKSKAGVSALDKLEVSAGIKGKGYAQLTAAPVLFVDAKGEVVASPVTRSYSEGLTVADYWASSSGGRKGVIQKVQSVREPGYLTKLMMNTTMNTLVQEEDCGTHRGISLKVDEPDVVGRYTTSTIKAGKTSIPEHTLITPEILSKMRNSKVSRVLVRSPMRCDHTKGVCKCCMGLDENGQLPDLGTNVGVLAAQAIGERGTQLAMKSFHSGGVFEGRETAEKSITGGGLERATTILHMPRKVKGSAKLATTGGKVTGIRKDPAGGFNVVISGQQHYVPADRKLLSGVKVGTTVKKGYPITSGPVNPHELLPLANMNKVQGYLASELHNIYSSEGIKRRNAEVVVRSLSNITKVEDPGDNPDLIHGDFAPTSVVNKWNRKNQKAGKLPVRHAPVLLGVKQIPLEVQEDWLARLNHENLRGTIVDAAQQGWSSQLHGEHPIPPLIYGAEFGKGTKKKPWSY